MQQDIPLALPLVAGRSVFRRFTTLHFFFLCILAVGNGAKRVVKTGSLCSRIYTDLLLVGMLLHCLAEQQSSVSLSQSLAQLLRTSLQNHHCSLRR